MHLLTRLRGFVPHPANVKVPETVFLAKSARAEGALAASAFGAGFGGSVWALVPTESVASFTVCLLSPFLPLFSPSLPRFSCPCLSRSVYLSCFMCACACARVLSFCVYPHPHPHLDPRTDTQYACSPSFRPLQSTLYACSPSFRPLQSTLYSQCPCFTKG